MAFPVRRRTRARELALQFLYTLEIRGPEALEELDEFLRHHVRRLPDAKGRDEIAAYARRLVLGVHEHLAELNQWIEQIAENWRLERMAHIDRNVLRLAIFELLYEQDVPFKVVINEAIEIAKRFSTSQSGSFVNGILDRARVLIEEARAHGEEVPRPPDRPMPRTPQVRPEPHRGTAPPPVPRPRRHRPAPPHALGTVRRRRLMVLDRLRRGLARTRNRIAGALRRLGGDSSEAESLEALEEILYTADVGPLAGEILIEAEERLRRGELAHPRELPDWLRGRLAGLVRGPEGPPLPRRPDQEGPLVVLVVGVNGSGKTTSVAKLVHWLQQRGDRVLVAAADTFRAAAVEQLTIWCQRLGAELVKGAPGADPAAVAHDAAVAARARGAAVLVVDTAGRLHTQRNVMAELEKVSRVLGHQVPGAPHEVLLVLDATTGQNAIQQARRFQETVPVSGVFLAKLDGTAKGGAVLAVSRELGLPVQFVGLGEGLEDLEVFDPEEFVTALLGPVAA